MPHKRHCNTIIAAKRQKVKFNRYINALTTKRPVVSHAEDCHVRGILRHED